jgi:hypothetical protein
MKQVKFIIIAFLLTQLSFSQKKDENIGTEVVNVVKPYTPTISDVFKVKETPTLDDEDTSKKEAIQYNIFSFPVASTFTPSKGRAASVDKSADEKIFSNYLTLGAGNYGTANVELFVTENISNTDYFGGMLRHSSSQGGINDVVLVAEPERCLGMLIWAIKIKFIIGMEFIPELLIMLRLIQ